MARSTGEITRQHRQQADERGRDGPRIRRPSGGVTQQCGRERTLLRQRQTRARLVKCSPDEVGQYGVRKPRFALGGSRLKHAVAPCFCGALSAEPKSRLPNSRLALEHEGGRTSRQSVEEPLDRIKFNLATDEQLQPGCHFRGQTPILRCRRRSFSSDGQKARDVDEEAHRRAARPSRKELWRVPPDAHLPEAGHPLRSSRSGFSRRRLTPRRWDPGG
jgi:hypothetical protein